MEAFGDSAREFNGTVPEKQRLANKDEFNDDASGVKVLLVQSDAGSGGISLHDTTGGHQRVLVNLGMPVKPTTSLQAEGRTRRVGSVSNAPYRYYTIGTTWEREAFARRIAEQSGAVENLAMGNEARAIQQSFIDA
jgi:superfamily II DNA/RNA helicase